MRIEVETDLLTAAGRHADSVTRALSEARSQLRLATDEVRWARGPVEGALGRLGETLAWALDRAGRAADARSRCLVGGAQAYAAVDRLAVDDPSVGG